MRNRFRRRLGRASVRVARLVDGSLPSASERVPRTLRRKRPVLKHGPRSPPLAQVGGRQTRRRSESETQPVPSLVRSRQRVRWDPKDGELCRKRAKPEETLVEARTCADVQIALQIFV